MLARAARGLWILAAIRRDRQWLSASIYAAMRQLLYSDVKKKSVLSQKTTVTLQRRKGKVGIKPENDNSFTAE